jgi:hypothetical protein
MIDIVNKNSKLNHNNLINYIFNFYLHNIATESTKEELNSNNYIFWITNNLCLLYKNSENIYKLIEGPCHNLVGNQITEIIVKNTHKHVRTFLMSLPEKELYSLIGIGIYNH